MDASQEPWVQQQFVQGSKSKTGGILQKNEVSFKEDSIHLNVHTINTMNADITFVIITIVTVFKLHAGSFGVRDNADEDSLKTLLKVMLNTFNLQTNIST